MRISIKESFEKKPAQAQVVGRIERIANNTFRYRTDDGREIIRLHVTDIIEKFPNGKVKLDSGGWKTSTTKSRLDMSGYQVYSDRGIWKVHDRKRDISVPFYDGITLPDAFDNAGTQRLAQAKADSQLKLKAAIKKFVTKTLPTGKPIPKPDNGDCWYCLMFDREEPVQNDGISFVGPAAAKPARVRDAEHLRKHVMEGYMPGSLVVNAFRDAGYTDQQIGFVVYGYALDHKRVRRLVIRYLNKRLGLTF